MKTIGQLLDFLALPKQDIDTNAPVSGIGFTENASETAILVIHQPSHLDLVNSSPSKFIFLDQNLKEKVPSELLSSKKKHLIFVKNPYLVFAKISQFFDNTSEFDFGAKSLAIHPSAIVSENVKLGKNVRIGPNVVLYPDVAIDDDSEIMANVVVGQNVKIGKNTKIFPNVSIYPHTVIGANVRIHSGSVLGSDGFGYAKQGTKNVKIIHSGKLIVEDNVEIGASTCIDRGTLEDTIIKSGTVIDNNVQIGHNCKIGEDSIICGLVGIPGGVEIGKCVTVGGMTGFNNKVKVGDYSQIGGMTGVTKDLPNNSAVSGRPMKPVRDFHKIQAYVNRLPELFETIKELKRELAKK